jgi:pyridinium-3,5-biscarboxylic acid mononucleotide synthase
MGREKLREMLARYRDGALAEEEIIAYLESLPFEDIHFAKIDHHRELRWGFPEVIFCQGKTPQQVLAIAHRIVDRGSNLLATRAGREVYDELKNELPNVRFHEAARALTMVVKDITLLPGKVVIVTAGTSDIPVAEEALVTGAMLGLDAAAIHDIGVSGIHRVMRYQQQIEDAAVIIVVAGMEGALASVIAGLTSSPVIAVPTSVGYGASFQGIAALLSMLNSCVPGVAVMNIDNGFGAAFLAFKILKTQNKTAGKP